MMSEFYENKTANIKFLEMCDEIDYWKNRCFVAEEELETIKEKFDRQTMDSIRHGNAMMGNFLKLAMYTDLEKLKSTFGDLPTT